MIELITKVLQGTASAAESRQVLRWRASSSDNERYYQDVSRVWRHTAAGDVSDRIDHEPDSWDVVRRAIVGSESAPAGSVSGRPTRRKRRWYVVAAAMVAAVVLGVGHLWQARVSAVVGSTEVVTEAGESVTVHLADGSFVRLAPHSRLEFAGAEAPRRVRLDGHAFFAVAADQQPFVVQTQTGEATVLGTRFDLDARGDDLRLLVVDGRVALSSGGDQVELGGGQMSKRSAETGLGVQTVDDVFERLDWMGYSFLFQSTPLPDVLEQIERVYGVELIIEDISLEDRTFTASFVDRPFEDVMNVICEVLSLDCTIEAGRARVSGSPLPAVVQ